MERYGSDRPDTRFGLELVDVSSVFAASEFKVFAGALAAGGAIKALNAKGAGDWSRGRIDALNQLAIDSGAKGLAWVAFPSEGEVRSPVAKFFSEAELTALTESLWRRARAISCAWSPTNAPRERGTRRAAHAPGRGARHRALRLRRAVGRGLPDVQVRRRRGALDGEPPPVHAARSTSTWRCSSRIPARCCPTPTTS